MIAFLVGLMALAGTTGSVVPSRAADIDRAVALWKEAGMPIPPSTALPVSQGDDYIHGIGDQFTSKGCTLYVGGYVLQNALGSYKRVPISWEALRARASTIDVSDGPANRGFPELGLVALAIQSAALGHQEIAKAIVARRRITRGSSAEWLGEPVDESLTANCAMAIYIHGANLLTDPKTDRSKLVEVLEVVAKHKLVRKSKDWRFGGDQGLDEFIQSLKLSNRPSTARPGTAQAAADDLVNATDKSDAVCKKVTSFGLDAVLPLSELLSSKKLSRAFSAGLNLSPSQILTVGFFSSVLLRDIAGGDLGTSGRLTKGDVLKWYEAKKAGSIEKMLMNSLFKKSGDLTYCNAETFDALAANYPHLLKAAYERVRKAQVHDWIALMAIESSKLTPKEKRDLVVYGAQGEGVDRLITAGPLHRLDRAEYDRLLLRHFAKIPKTFSEDYCYIPNYAIGTDNSEVWALLEEKVNGAGPSMRVALLNSLSGTADAIQPQYPKRAVTLLRKFFDDRSKPKDWNTVSTTGKARTGFGPEAPIVGDVALRAAAFASGILSTNVPEHISAAEWKAIRKRIEAGEIILHERD